MFITFEGPEGSGKTTAIEKVHKYLISKGKKVVITREPGGIEISEAIRSIILNKKNTQMHPKTEALLYAAARVQHLHEVILPALERGAIVLCDRFIDSSLAYQGIARGIGFDGIFNINDFAIENNYPDITILFDISPEEGLARINVDNKREVNRLDLETLEFHKAVYKGYKMLHEKFPDRIKSIDATKTPDEVANQIIDLVKNEI